MNDFARLAGRLDDDDDTGAATALAWHLERWQLGTGGQRSDVPPDDRAGARAVAAAGYALVQARSQGHVCLVGATLEPWLGALQRSPLVQVLPATGSGAPAGLQPLVLCLDADGPRLYLRRDHALELELAQHLARRVRAGRLRLLSGGPGSGKTTRVAALLAEGRRQRPDLRVVLLAPTGKAAARMNEALAGAAADLPMPRAQTVHRWLGIRPGLADATRPSAPLPADLVIVDEASMLDLDLATALVRAVPDTAELLLVGDAGQLAAVEAGAVFAEACAYAWPAGAGAVHEQLAGSRRYAAGSPIARLADALREGDGDAASGCGGELLLGMRGSPGGFDEALALGLAPYVASLRDPAATPAMHLTARRGFLVLAARHAGPDGVSALNRRVGQWLQRQCGQSPARDPAQPWPGRAVMVLRNDPSTGLANGDIGILWPTAGEAAPGFAGWQAWFDDGPQQGPRPVALERLPPHTDAFAMTVHKAQGSEADTVLVLLPEPAHARREWLYTAVTRARRRLWLAGDAATLAQAARRPAPRDGGLRLRLDEALGRHLSQPPE